MELHTPLSLIWSVICASLGLFIGARDPRASASRALSALFLAISWWSLCEFVWNNAPGPALALRWVHLASPGFLFLGGIYLHFVLAFTRDPHHGPLRTLAALYAPPAAILAFAWAGAPLFERVTPAPWGWSYWPSPLYAAFLLHLIVCFAIGLRLLWRLLREASSPAERRRARIVFIATIIPIVSGSLTDGVLPMVGVQVFHLGTPTCTLMAALFIYALIRHKRLLLTAEGVAAEVLATIPDAVFLADTSGRLRPMNAAAAALSGREARPGDAGAERDLSMDDLIEVPPRRQGGEGGSLALLQDLRETDAVVRSAGGLRTPVTLNTSALLDEDGGLAGLVIVAHDVRHLRRLQAQLVQSEKMAAVGQLAAGIAHEVNNPMTYLSLNLHKLRDQIDALRADAVDGKAGAEERFDEMLEMLEESAEGAARIREIVHNVREFSHPGGGGPELVDVNAEIEKALRIAQSEIRNAAAVQRDFGQVPPVLGSRSDLRQVLVNLLVNAAQAFDDPGTITVRSRAGEGTVAVEVEDDGPGVNPDALPYIFDPFYTTKEVGRGTGLGLTISYQLVQRMSGRITVRSTPGAGTLFRIELPLATP
jgi:signal transduction histidine kinase